MNRRRWLRELARHEQEVIKQPRDGLVWLKYAGFLLTECDALEQTIQAYELARKHLRQPNPAVGMILGSLYAKRGEHTRGIAAMRSVLRVHPTNYGYCMLAKALLAANHRRQALNYANRVLKCDSSYDEAHVVRAAALENTRPLSALRAYRTAVVIAPRNGAAWLGLGFLLLKSDRTSVEGRRALHRAVRLQHNPGLAWASLANSHWHAGELRSADRAYRAAMRADPSDPRLRRWYSQFLNAHPERKNRAQSRSVSRRPRLNGKHPRRNCRPKPACKPGRT